ncbi:MAG: hypothetical protein NXI30_04515 [bacterium]|nr:hypothetical protein [bacterium]
MAAVALGVGSLLVGSSIGSSVFSSIGFGKRSKAEEEAEQLAALIARERTRVSAARSRRQSARTLAWQRGMVGRSGVSLEGSQIDLLTENAKELEMTAIYIERFGELEAEAAEARADSIEEAARIGKVLGVLQGVTNAGSIAYSMFGTPGGAGSGVTTDPRPEQTPAQRANSNSLYRNRIQR